MDKLKFALVAFIVLIVSVSFQEATNAQASGARRIEITASKFSFSPAEVTVKKGQPVTLAVKSLDVSHGLRVRELGVDIKVQKNKTAEVSFTPDKTGDFVGHCSVFCGSGHGSMALKIHVVD